ncbi:MAG: CAP domain-containing protein [Salibacteraceae bacterium]
MSITLFVFGLFFWMHVGQSEGPSVEQPKSYEVCLSQEEMKLYRFINAYRKESGLNAVPLSKSLSYVAKTHCRDLLANHADLEDGCNSHSWSMKGEWSGCCYTADHKAATCMWDKPAELTNYPGQGFEIAFGSSSKEFERFPATAQSALDGWKTSVHHNAVIVNRDIWKEVKWNAVGVGIEKGVATVWFGRETDPDGKPKLCGE